jgi:hypothetical protein
VLGDSEAIRMQAGKVSLATDRVWVDALSLQKALREGRATGVALLQRGEFLAREPEAPWMLPVRERLRHLLRDRTASDLAATSRAAAPRSITLG